MKSLGNIIGELLKTELQEEFERNPPAPRPRPQGGRPRPEAFDFLALIQEWPKIVGDRMARHTRPKQNKGGTLTVLTSHPAYSEQLSHMAPKIIEKVTKHFPSLQGKIKRIVFQTNSGFFAQEAAEGPVSRPAQAGGPKERAPLHPYSPEFLRLKGEAERLVGDIPEAEADPELRASLMAMYIQMNRSQD